MALIRARHAVYGVCLIPEGKAALHPDDWTPVEPPPARPRPRRTQTRPAAGEASEPSGGEAGDTTEES